MGRVRSVALTLFKYSLTYLHIFRGHIAPLFWLPYLVNNWVWRNQIRSFLLPKWGRRKHKAKTNQASLLTLSCGKKIGPTSSKTFNMRQTFNMSDQYEIHKLEKHVNLDYAVTSLFNGQRQESRSRGKSSHPGDNRSGLRQVNHTVYRNREPRSSKRLPQITTRKGNPLSKCSHLDKGRACATSGRRRLRERPPKRFVLFCLCVCVCVLWERQWEKINVFILTSGSIFL